MIISTYQSIYEAETSEWHNSQKKYSSSIFNIYLLIFFLLGSILHLYESFTPF